MRTPSWKILIIMSFLGGLIGKEQKVLPRKVLVIESNSHLEILDDPRSFYEKHKGIDFVTVTTSLKDCAVFVGEINL